MNFQHFQDIFGGSLATGWLAPAVAGFFENGGTGCWVARSDPGLPAGKEAIARLMEIDEIALMAAPEAALPENVGLDVQLVQECEKMGDRLVILSGPNKGDPAALRPPISSSYAAIYYPWVAVPSLVDGASRAVPPAGHVAGMFARMHAQRGVWKAPAGEELRGVSGLTVALGEFERGDLNTRGINLIVALANRGVCVWGARTADLGSEYRYVNVRRLLIYLKESISRSLQWDLHDQSGRLA